MDVRIKVLKTEFYEDIADEYLSEGRAVGPCPILKEGDTFLYKSGEEAVMPEGFCPWAWVDLYAAISRRAIDRAPREAGKEYWYKHENKTIECCTDGVRPVIFFAGGGSGGRMMCMADWPEIKKDRYKAGYRDYQRLNYLLGKKYNLRYNIRNISIEEINEVKGELLENFLCALKDDIQYASEAKVEELEIYKLELMEEYINQSVAMCESEMAAFFRGEERERPENYYVNII